MNREDSSLASPHCLGKAPLTSVPGSLPFESDVTQTIMLPRYTKQYDDRDPLLPTAGHRQGRESIETAPPTYPPAGPSTADGRHNVEYSYTPVYPRKGKAEHVVGVLGNTKQVCIFGSGGRLDSMVSS